jgi:hypothetical protein
MVFHLRSKERSFHQLGKSQDVNRGTPDGPPGLIRLQHRLADVDDYRALARQPEDLVAILHEALLAISDNLGERGRVGIAISLGLIEWELSNIPQYGGGNRRSLPRHNGLFAQWEPTVS